MSQQGSTRSRRTIGPRVEAGLLVLLLGVWASTWLPRLQGPIDLRWDAAVYYSLGTALAQGKGLRLLNEPGEIYGIQYPPGLPAVVAVHQRILGTADPVVVGTALRRFYLALSGIYILGLYWLLRRAFGPLAAFLGAAICALSMNLVWLSDRYYSDVPFLLATTGFLLLARQPARIAQLGTGTAAVIAFWLRTLGAALFIGWIAEAAVTREWRRVATRLLLATIVLGSWQGYVWVVEHSPGYRMPAYPYQRAPYLLYNVTYTTNASLKVPFQPELGYLSAVDVLKRFLENARDLPGTIGEVLSTSATDWSEALAPIRNVPGLGLLARWRVIRAGLIALGLLALSGLWYQWRLGHVRELATFAGYLVALCAMNFTQELGRYLTGIQPLVVVLLFTAVLRARPRTGRLGVPHAALGLLVCAIVFGEVATLKKTYAEGFPPVTHRWAGHDVAYRLFSYSEAFRSFDEGIEWLTMNVAPAEIIASSQPHWVYLRTARRAVMPPFERDPARHQALLDSVPVSYVMVDSNGFSPTREYSLAALKSERHWELVYNSADHLLQVYRRRGASAVSGSSMPARE